LQGATRVCLKREKNLRLRDHIAVGVGKRLYSPAVCGWETRRLAIEERQTKFCVYFGD